MKTINFTPFFSFSIVCGIALALLNIIAGRYIDAFYLSVISLCVYAIRQTDKLKQMYADELNDTLKQWSEQNEVIKKELEQCKAALKQAYIDKYNLQQDKLKVKDYDTRTDRQIRGTKKKNQ
jgi:hypothetical protein